MILDSLQYREALSNLGPEPAVFVEPPAHFRQWLLQKRLPDSLIEFLVGNAVSRNIPFYDTGGMWTPENIMALNDQESAILACGLLALGNTTNGDFIVLDLAEGVDGVGFVGHDELADEPGNVRDIYVPVDASLHDLLTGMTTELRKWRQGIRATSGYPNSYWDALERAQKANPS